MTEPGDFDTARRFAGVARLYGSEALRTFAAAHVCVVGIGGVGSWAAEALARSAVGHLTLIDLDMIAESNVNRQIHALGDEFGKAKVGAMAARIRAINPDCVVREIEDFVTPDNLPDLLGGGFDHVIDAIDEVRTKVAMIAWCRRQGIPLITAGGAGGRIDATRIRIDDLARTLQDPLLSRVRAQLRKEHGFPREAGRKFGIPAVFSCEPLRRPAPDDSAVTGQCTAPPSGGLACAGYGSAVSITATFGFFAAGEVLKRLAEPRCRA